MLNNLSYLADTQTDKVGQKHNLLGGGKNTLVTKQDPLQSASANFVTEEDLHPEKILRIWICRLTCLQSAHL